MLQGVRNQFVQDEPAGDRLVQVETDRLHVHFEMDTHRVHAVRREQLTRQDFDVSAEIQVGKRVGLINELVNQRHREDAAVGVVQRPQGVLGGAGNLHGKQAADDLEIVFNS